MQARPLNDSSNAMYRVSAKAIIKNGDKILLVRDWDDEWWSFPGGGIDYGENPVQALTRELCEELGVSSEDIHIDNKLVYIGIGAIVEEVPRTNIFFLATVDPSKIIATAEIVESQWFKYDDYARLNIVPMAIDHTELNNILQQQIASVT